MSTQIPELCCLKNICKEDDKKINRPKTITNADADKIRQNLFGVYQLIFDLSIETGLRISDVLRIKRFQIAQEISVWESKTKKIKTVKLSDGLFLRLKHLRTKTDTKEYAFASPRSARKHLHRSTYHRQLKRASTGLQIALSAHSTRKLYAQNIFEQTGDIFAVQKSLNHKYITTTCAYLDIDLPTLIRKESEKNARTK